MGRKEETQARFMNGATYIDYLNRLKEISMNMFEWHGLPNSIDERFLEKILMEQGKILFFEDPVLGWLTLPCTLSGELDVYDIPIRRDVHASNGYTATYGTSDSVIIWNNYMHEPTLRTLDLYARRLATIDRTIDVNIHAQKTPVTILCDERQVLTVKNLYKKYEGNEPVIIGDKSLDINNIKVLDTKAPFVSTELQALKKNLWMEALSFCGVENANTNKAERLVSTEVQANQGNVEAQRYIRLNARRDAAKRMSELCGFEITVDFRSGIGALALGDTTFDVVAKEGDSLIVTDGGEFK